MTKSDERSMMLSYVRESLDHLNHYIEYRGRMFADLIVLQTEIDKLTASINTRLVRDFKEQTQEYLNIKY